MQGMQKITKSFVVQSKEVFMISMRLVGGIGNSLFIYARGLALAKKYDVRLLDQCTQYGCSLGRFNISLPFTKSPEGRWIGEGSLRFDPNPEIEDPCVLTGYYQSEKYFLDVAAELRQEFTLREPLAIPEYPNSVAVHVRRGDYLTWAAASHGALPLDYYLRAANYLVDRFQGLKFYVFTDDPEWARQNFRFPHPFSVIHKTPHEDLMIMSKCRHAIIANSSFSWWGAWLGADKTGTVIAPKDWFKTTEYDSRDIVPERWVKM